MTSTRRLQRRYFLRGAGALLAVPVLESLLPREARGAPGDAPKRVLFWLQDHGNLRDEWQPRRTSGGFTLPYVLSPLDPYKNDIIVISGLDNHATRNHNGNAHPIGNATMLTAIARTDAANVGEGASGGGPSIDQYLAGRLPVAPRRSVGINLPTGSGAVSYLGAQQPAGTTYLSNAFNDLFGNFNGSTDPVVIARRRATRESVIDAVLENFHQVNTRVSADDKKKLDLHLSQLRDLETRLALEAQGVSCAPTNRNTLQFNAYAASLYSMAFACQLTNVGTYMSDVPEYDRTYTGTFPLGYHGWIHQGPDYGLDPVRRREDWRNAMNWYAAGFAAMVSAFKATPDVGGATLLDNSLLVWTNVFGMGSYHDFFEIPTVLAGRAGGTLATGRWLDYRRARAAAPTTYGGGMFVNETTNNLYVSVCRAMGLSDVTTFGDASLCSGGLPGLVS